MSLGRDTVWHPDSYSTELVSLVNSDFSPNTTHGFNTHTRSGENRTKIWLWAITPLILHLATALVLVGFLAFRIDNHDFNLHSRNASTHFTPLQSDITTAVSAGVTITRFFVAMWSAATIWRFIFILMEKDGISLQQINTLLTCQIHFLPRLNSSRKVGLLISIVLYLSFPCQLSGPILTGSITWSSSNSFIDGGKLTNISAAGPIRTTLNLSSWDYNPMYAQLANGYAINAWQGSRESQGIMKRVVESAFSIPTNSTLNNITIPYFAVTNLEWIKDPIREVPPVVIQSFMNISKDWNPFRLHPLLLSVPGTFAIIPDTWGIGSGPLDGAIVTETRYIVGRTGNRPTCIERLFGDLLADIGQYNNPDYGCYIFGRISYVAGASECRKCRFSSWLAVQNDTELTVSPDNTTMYAITLMPMVGAMTAYQNLSLPGTYHNLDGYVTELLTRSYGASWASLQYALSGSSAFLETDVQIAVPTSRANVLWWRAFLWLTLNLMFTLSGLIFFVIQWTCDQPLIGNPALAALLLDTTEVQHKRDRAFCNFSTLVGDDKDIGYVYLKNTKGGGHKRAEILEC